MASHVDEEECFENYFANEPKLQLPFFIIKSLYNGGRNVILDDRNLAKQFQVNRFEVLNAVDEINQCSPEVASFRQNSEYRKTITTEKGRNILRYDITKLVPKGGVYFTYLKKICPNDLINEYFRKKWLDKNRNVPQLLVVRGEKYLEYVHLYNSLCLIEESDLVADREDLDEMNWIKVISGRYEIYRGPRFPASNLEKLTFLYKLAVKIFDQNISLAVAFFNSIQEQEKVFEYHQNKVISEKDCINKEIDDYNFTSYRLSQERQSLLLIQKHINRLRDRGFSVPQLRELEIPTETRSSKKVLLPQPQIRLFSRQQIQDLQEQMQQHRFTFLPTLPQVQQHFEQDKQHELQLMQQQLQQQSLHLSQLQHWLPQQQMLHLQQQPMQLPHQQQRREPLVRQQMKEKKQLLQSQPSQQANQSSQQTQQHFERNYDPLLLLRTDRPSSSSVAVKMKND